MDTPRFFWACRLNSQSSDLGRGDGSIMELRWLS